MKAPIVERDERTVAVENAGYAVGYKLVAYALLLDVIYRSLWLGDASWDLMGIVIVSSFVILAYQKKFQALANNTFRKMAVVFLVAAALAGLVVLIASALLK